MPHYDYVCLDCAHVFEVFQMMSDDPLAHCPTCGGRVKRKIGGGMGIIFKGSGFYVTDYKNSSSASSKQSSCKSEHSCEGCTE